MRHNAGGVVGEIADIATFKAEAFAAAAQDLPLGVTYALHTASPAAGRKNLIVFIASLAYILWPAGPTGN